MRLTFFALPLFVLLSRCSSTSADGNDTRNAKDEDQPMSVSLGQQLVSRRNETNSPSTSSSLFMEGGSINKSTEAVPAAVDDKESLLPSNTTRDILPADGAMAVSWPEGQDKNSSIKPRKGVSANIDEIGSITATPCSCCINITSEEMLKNCLCCPPDFKINSSTMKPKAVTVNSTVKDIAVVSTTSSSTSTVAPSVPLNIVPSPISHHHKPNVTADVPDLQVPAQQEDYVIPVVGIIFAIPLAIILGALVYKKGADLWERRHYRRMDFLIDGIYNQ